MTLPTISEAIIHLSSHISTEIDRLHTGQTPLKKTDSLVFIGQWQDAIPRSIWVDPLLDAVDIRCWGLIRTQAVSGSAVILSLNQLLENQLHYSRATISKVIYVLRMTRWITLCSGLRSPKTGQFQGNVYAVHDTPCDINEAIYLDEDYLAFVKQQMFHKDGRISGIAHTVWRGIEESLAKGTAHLSQQDSVPVNHFTGQFYQEASPVYYVNLGTKFPVEPVQKMVPVETQHAQIVNLDDNSCVQKMDMGENHRVQIVNLDENDRVQKMNLGENPRVQILNPDENVQVQKMNTVQKEQEIQVKQPLDNLVKKLNLVKNVACSCSSYINNKTTTTTNAEKIEKIVFEKIPLVFPVDLKPREIHLAECNLTRIAPDLHQAFLDEVSAQIHARRKTSNPIRNPIGYLAWMCNAHLDGVVVLTSLGIWHSEKREKQASLDGQVQEQKQQPVPVKKPAGQVATRRVDYKDRIQALRDGLRSGKNSQADNATYPGQLGAMGYGGQAARVGI